MSCADCFKGVLLEGTPVGKTEKIAGIETYVSLPKGDYDKSKAVVYLGDIFGQYVNAKLICDSFAENGYATYFPDYLFGDPVPTENMNGPPFDRATWFKKHTPKVSREHLDPVLEQLKKDGVTSIGATGYCFGGGPVRDLSEENLISAGVVAHPAQIAMPEGMENLVKNSNVPFLINACETDATWPKEHQDTAANLMANYKPGFKQNYYAGVSHGFAARGDPKVPVQKKAKEDAFEATVEWFNKYL